MFRQVATCQLQERASLTARWLAGMTALALLASSACDSSVAAPTPLPLEGRCVGALTATSRAAERQSLD